MTRVGIKEYVEALRERYSRCSKKEKGKVLDEFVRVVECHRKSAVRLLSEKKANYKVGRAAARCTKVR